MSGLERLRERPQRSLVERLRLVETPLLREQERQIVGRDRVVEPALRLPDSGEVVEVHGDLVVVGTERALERSPWRDDTFARPRRAAPARRRWRPARRGRRPHRDGRHPASAHAAPRTAAREARHARTRREFRATRSMTPAAMRARSVHSAMKVVSREAGTDLYRYAQEDGRVILPATITGPLGNLWCASTSATPPPAPCATARPKRRSR